VRLPLDPASRLTSFVVRGPDGKTAERLGKPEGGAALTIEAPAQLGPWSVDAAGPEGASRRFGFSVNPPRAEDRIAPLTKAELDALFAGEKNYRVADDEASLEREVKTGRIGQEVFPLIMMLILALVTAENFLANRFYRERAPAQLA